MAAPRFVCALRFMLVALLCLGLPGCGSLLSWNERAASMARDAGFVPLESGRFVRMYLKAPAAAGADLTVYFEGDGARWPGRSAPPADPTPQNPLALRLAIQDSAAAVAYVGRPCQYLDDTALADCNPDLWINGRYSEPAVAMMSQAVAALVARTGATRLTLIGHSGGGAMAALVAARRRDVACLVTVASPLDIRAWTEAVGDSPLATSLNPLDAAPRLGSIPQVHFTGDRDDTVPPASIAAYLKAVPGAREVRIAGFDHDDYWVRDWVKLRAQACPQGKAGQ